jgi:hypothetical protein
MSFFALSARPMRSVQSESARKAAGAAVTTTLTVLFAAE